MNTKITLTLLSLASSLLATDIIQTIDIRGNVKISSKTLQKVVQSHIGQPYDENQTRAIETDVESYYREHNYTLAYAVMEPSDENNGSLKLRIGKYADFNERAVGEMKRRALQPGMINQIFFVGNEKISTCRLTAIVTPLLGKENNAANLDELLNTVQNYYRQHRFELAYVNIKNSGDEGIVTVEIKKYPNFKARYVRDGKR